VADVVQLTVQVWPEPGGDDEELADLTARLRGELLDVDVDAVESLTEADAPEWAKGLGALVGWLAVRLSWTRAREVISAAREWAGRNNRVIEVSYGGDSLKVTGVTSEQQERLIDDWLARHAAGA
jgi:hypothetical protein